MPASRQSGYDGSESKRAWETPIVAALPIRATASSWGFKWDSGWGGGKGSSVIAAQPADRAAPIHRRTRLAHVRSTRSGKARSSRRCRSAPPPPAGGPSSTPTWRSSRRLNRAPPAQPSRAECGGSVVTRAAALPASPIDAVGRHPTVKALSLRDTASSWGIKCGPLHGRRKMETVPAVRRLAPATGHIAGGAVARARPAALISAIRKRPRSRRYRSLHRDYRRLISHLRRSNS